MVEDNSVTDVNNTDGIIIRFLLKPGTTPCLDFLINHGNCIQIVETGKTYVVKSKYRLVNFFRKLFNCEKTEKEYFYKYTLPYTK